MTRLPLDVTGRVANTLRSACEDRAHWIALLAALDLVVLVRSAVPYGRVFRDGAVTLAANDPYRYRYWVDVLVASGRNPFDPWDLAQMPDAVQQGDVMFTWTMWLAADVYGGGARTPGLVLAWYPVVSAVVTAVLVYAMAARLTADRRVALLSVVVLGLTPAHAYRTMLGFGDHHAFDYVALALAATALVWLASMDPSERPWRRPEWLVASGLLGGAVAAQPLGWRGGPILLIPLGVYAVAATASAVRAGRPPALENSGLLAGLLVASGLAALIHVGPNWAPPYRGFAPLLLLGSVAGVLGVGELAVRRGLGWPGVVTGAPLAVLTWLLFAVLALPSLLDGVWGFVAFLERTSAQREVGIGETASLVGSLETPLLLFGLLLLVALPAMAWVLVEVGREHRPAWIAVSAYAWVFLALSVNRVRFTGPLAVFVAVFAAVGLLRLAARMEFVEPASPFDRWPRPSVLDWTPSETESRAVRTAGAVFVLVLLVTGVGVAQVPGTMNEVTVDDTQHEAARWMAAYADVRGWTYPRSYVFSSWGTNLAYNYEVSGESRSYGYARRNFRAFVSSSDAAGWYEALAGTTGFVVVRTSAYEYPPDSMHARLVERYGSAGEDGPGLAHYRLMYVSDDSSLLVFTLVPGATIVGNATPERTVRVETTVTVSGRSFTYRRSVRAGADGRFAVTVSYPGRYVVGGSPVVVTEADVSGGETVGR